MFRRKGALAAAAASKNTKNAHETETPNDYKNIQQNVQQNTQQDAQQDAQQNSSLAPGADFCRPVAAQLKGVSKIFPNPNPKLPPLAPALNHVSACIPAGCISGVVGPDAAGKTTLMRLLAGLLQPSSGQVLVLQTAMAPSGGSLPEVGYMPQRFGLYEDLSVLDNLKLHAQLRGLEGAACEQTFAQLLSFTDLARFQGRLAGNLSGGMKQKLGLACALLGTPRLLLLDEPGVGVDPESRRELWSMVTTLASDGMSILWSTAYIEEAERCPHVLVLSEGNLIYQGEPGTFTKEVEKRVFFVTGLPEENSQPAPLPLEKPKPREILLYWSSQPFVRDALVQGSKVRVVLDITNPQPAALFTPTKPRLEDAYMDAMGGIAKNASPFLSFGNLDDTALPGAQPGKIATLQKMPIIVAENLTKRFGSFVAARDISFSVEPGKIFGLLGPNGAGKSTTFRMLCGLSKPTQGECFVAGVNLLRSGSQARSQLGYMAQKFSLYQDLTLNQNIHLFARLYGIAPKLRDERLALLVEALELKDYLHRQTKDLPLGQRQRLALVCATIHNPKALFLDEPTSGVDPRTRRDFWKHINALTKQGVAVLVTTHFMEEAEYCDEIALIYRGAIIASGSPDSLKAQCPQKNSAAGQAFDPTLEDAFIAYIHASSDSNDSSDSRDSRDATTSIMSTASSASTAIASTASTSIASTASTASTASSASSASSASTASTASSASASREIQGDAHFEIPSLRWFSQVLALIAKEFKQIVRDPSSYLVAFVLPTILLLCFGFAISMDAGIMQLALIDESRGAISRELSLAFEQSPHFNLHISPARKVASQMMSDSVVQGVLIIPSNFDILLASGQNAPLQLLIDGSEPNTANFIRGHSEGTVNNWQLTRMNGGAVQRMPIEIQSSIWFNSSAKSRWALLPGSITVIMTLIGTVLTSLVITREWERGTMEAMFATPVTRMQIFIGKFIPYYFLAMTSMLLCTVLSVFLFGVPFRGSVAMLLILSTFFLLPSLGQGLFISSLFRSQLLSAMIGFLSGMLPSFILSGLIFDIHSMPTPLQYISAIIPAKYFNVCLQTLFLVGDVPAVFLPRMAYMLALGLLFFALAYRNLKKRLD